MGANRVDKEPEKRVPDTRRARICVISGSLFGEYNILTGDRIPEDGRVLEHLLASGFDCCKLAFTNHSGPVSMQSQYRTREEAAH